MDKNAIIFVNDETNICALDYYDCATHPTTWSGIWASAQNGNIKFVRTGEAVLLTLPEVLANANASAKISIDTILTASFRPAADVTFLIKVRDDAASDVLGSAVVKSTGSIEISIGASEGNYAGTSAVSTSGFRGFSLSYVI